MTAGGWLLAICRDCAPVLPQPFRNTLAGQAERGEWASAHREGTGHRVDLAYENGTLRAVLAEDRGGSEVYDVIDDGRQVARADLAKPGFSPAFLYVRRLPGSGNVELGWEASPGLRSGA